MVFGMSLATYTLIHVIISLIGIVSGLIVLFAMFGGKRLDGMTDKRVRQRHRAGVVKWADKLTSFPTELRAKKLWCVWRYEPGFTASS
jgi:hypothetical protein